MADTEVLSIYDVETVLKQFNIDTLRTPKVTNNVISISFKEPSTTNNVNFYIPDKTLLTLPSSELIVVKLLSAKRLTFGEDVKKTLELTFKFEDQMVAYQPGDAFGIICPNSESEVTAFLERLNILHQADKTSNILVHDITKGKKIPKHLEGCLTLRELLMWRVEIRSVPKKVLLKVFSEYTSDDTEKKCLQLLSSQEGSELFTESIRKPFLTVLDILMHYKSCNPPIEKILEFLPSLKPRFYSVISSPLVDAKTFSVVFNVIKIKKGDSRFYDREGVCTGWLNHLSMQLQLECDKQSVVEGVTTGISALSLGYKGNEVLIYKRQNLHFCMPDDLKIPLIMIGPGTGVAPFLGFLQHREQQMLASKPDVMLGETWLFYGCRYKQKDFIYQEEFQRLQSCNVLSHFIVSFSREASSSSEGPVCHYVHESLKLHSKVITAAVNSGAMIFVCGDAKHMAQDVMQAFIEVFQTIMGLSSDEAKNFVNALKNQNRYITDVWA